MKSERKSATIDVLVQEVQTRLHAVLSENSSSLLDAILTRAEGMEIDEHGYAVHSFIDADETWQIGPESQFDHRLGARLAKTLAVCKEMIWGEAGDSSQIWLHDGSKGTLHTIGEEIAPAGIAYAPDICSPIDIGLSSFYYLDPGSGLLMFYDEGHPLAVTDSQDVVEVYLREICFEVVPGAAHRSSWLDEP